VKKRQFHIHGAIFLLVLLIIATGPVSAGEYYLGSGDEKSESGSGSITGALVVTAASLALSIYSGRNMILDWNESDAWADSAWKAAGDTLNPDYERIRSFSIQAIDSWKDGNRWRNYFAVSLTALAVSGYLLHAVITEMNIDQSDGKPEGASVHGAKKTDPKEVGTYDGTIPGGHRGIFTSIEIRPFFFAGAEQKGISAVTGVEIRF
jgi:hypothetical protein